MEKNKIRQEFEAPFSSKEKVGFQKNDKLRQELVQLYNHYTKEWYSYRKVLTSNENKEIYELNKLYSDALTALETKYKPITLP